MIKLTNLEKYFNKNKLNEIHVINNTSLTFPETGLVALTGPSGCGKTTLLNVIGGLDKFDGGEISFDNELIKEYNPTRWDILRNHYVGYIFQNYNLVTDKTVYENVEIALNMAGLYEKDLVEERIHYVLKSVGMYNYRKRNVQALSGGQQQRVAIARAIAKNPKVILADEPTGNLDVNNTFDVMTIIKKISKTCLVILVSHERELVDFYADRVVELLDGKVVNDYENQGDRTLDRIDDRNIYLKDFEKTVADSPVEVEYYYHELPAHKPNVKLIYLNNAVYVKVDSSLKVKYLTNESEIRLLDEHYKKPEATDIHKNLFDLNQFGTIQTDAKRKSFIRFKDTLLQGFLKVVNGQKFFGKLFLLVYFVVSALIVYSLATFGSLTKVDERDYMSTPHNVVEVLVDDNLTYDDVLEILSETSADKVLAYNAQQFLRFSFRDLYQGSGQWISAETTSRAFPLSLSDIPAGTTIVTGRMPENNREIAIDSWVADAILEMKEVSDLGVVAYENLIGGSVSGGYYAAISSLTIVGVIESSSPIVVVTDANEFYFHAYSADSGTWSIGSIASSDIVMVEGTNAPGVGEIMMNDMVGLPLGSTYVRNGVTYEIVGLFDMAEDLDYEFLALMNNDDFEMLLLKYNLVEALGGDLLFMSPDSATLITEMATLEVAGADPIVKARNEYLASLANSIAGRLQTIVITMAGVVIYIFFMMRSSMLGRIREIGIYRSIGATKRDIYKIFFSEILSFTTLGSLTGYLFMTYLLNRIQGMLGTLVEAFYLPAYLFFGGILAIYLANIIFGMIPIFTLLRKTPSEINAKYDI